MTYYNDWIVQIMKSTHVAINVKINSLFHMHLKFKFP